LVGLFVDWFIVSLLNLLVS